MDLTNKDVLIYFAGVYTGSAMAYIFITKKFSGLKKNMDQTNTLSRLVLDLDQWIYETIDSVVELEEWTEELRSRLEYVRMVQALFMLED